jgi:hypothetical protein
MPVDTRGRGGGRRRRIPTGPRDGTPSASDRTDPAAAARVDVGVRPCAQRVQRSEDQAPQVGRPPSRARAGVGSIVGTERRRHFDGLEVPTAKRVQALPVESSKLRLIVGVIALEVRDRCRKQAFALAEFTETPNLSEEARERDDRHQLTSVSRVSDYGDLAALDPLVQRRHTHSEHVGGPPLWDGSLLSRPSLHHALEPTPDVLTTTLPLGGLKVDQILNDVFDRSHVSRIPVPLAFSSIFRKRPALERDRRSIKACHAEGREFESLQPLVTKALQIAGPSSFWGRFPSTWC